MDHPTTRVLAVLELLQTRGSMSGAAMAENGWVSMDARCAGTFLLEEMGIPMTAERGRYGGYSLVAGFNLPPMMFTDD